MKGRRIIFIGDSMSWQMYNSLACLLAPVTDHGTGGAWDKANTTVKGTYSGREWPDSRHIMMQYFSQVSLPSHCCLRARYFDMRSLSSCAVDFIPVTQLKFSPYDVHSKFPALAPWHYCNQQLG